MTAAVALITMAAERGCATARNGVEYLDLWIGQGSPIAIQESTAAPVNDISHLPGWRCHHSSLEPIVFLKISDRDLIQRIDRSLQMSARDMQINRRIFQTLVS